ncbi:PREDICTED: splicing factor 3A subunit 2 isoform X1 [Colobus angolensis palliatus]|uniref:splicing factor 3A subunit 2 isoform X1 n=1 Tax=Colobus angolensis palliatus TaxID=336983 RepID=UPI0005F5462F|nr:PREDICTED: splicing factor 3A subunit 2 isoform X1 [Colobus angolensis palliatus]
MDFQHRPGGKTGSGGVASSSESNRDRRERLRQLALETIDINKDPYFMKNHLGSYECKLCLTLHNNEGSYLAHTQGKKHQTNLARRAAKEAKEAPAQPAPEKVKVEVKKFVKIGRPGYKVTKQRDSEMGQQSLLFQIDYPEIAEGIMPRHRFMSAYEQRIEPPDRRWQYLLMAAEPYETIAFKVPSREIDKAEGKFWTHWNRETKQFFLQFHFKMEKAPGTTPATPASSRGPPPGPSGTSPRIWRPSPSSWGPSPSSWRPSPSPWSPPTSLWGPSPSSRSPPSSPRGSPTSPRGSPTSPWSPPTSPWGSSTSPGGPSSPISGGSSPGPRGTPSSPCRSPSGPRGAPTSPRDAPSGPGSPPPTSWGPSISSWGPPSASWSSPLKSWGTSPNSHAPNAEAPTPLRRPRKHTSPSPNQLRSCSLPQQAQRQVLLPFPTEKAALLYGPLLIKHPSPALSALMSAAPPSLVSAVWECQAQHHP